MNEGRHVAPADADTHPAQTETEATPDAPPEPTLTAATSRRGTIGTLALYEAIIGQTRSRSVELLQEGLREVGAYDGAVTGVADQPTVDAFRRVQRHLGLDETRLNVAAIEFVGLTVSE